MSRALSAQTEERARLLLSEGLPATWVAEDLALRSDDIYPVSASIPDRAEHVLAWQQEWARIRRNPVLLALHREFNPAAPRGTKSAA